MKSMSEQASNNREVIAVEYCKKSDRVYTTFDRQKQPLFSPLSLMVSLVAILGLVPASFATALFVTPVFYRIFLKALPNAVADDAQ